VDSEPAGSVGYVRARLRVVTVADGGPAAGVESGSRPNWGIGQRLSGDALLGRATATVEHGGRIEPGESGVIRLHPDDWTAWAQVRPGDAFPMLDGPRIVGVAQVLEIVPPAARYRK
jgi:hypothetical protein